MHDNYQLSLNNVPNNVKKIHFWDMSTQEANSTLQHVAVNS